MSIIDRIGWFCRRQLLNRHNSHAHFQSFVSRDCELGGYNKLAKGTVLNDVTLGRATYVAGAKIARARIGAFCSIGPECLIGGLGKHPTDWISTHPSFYSTRLQAGLAFAKIQRFEETDVVRIGNDVWIGARAIILDGVSIGDGAIIAAGAVVAQNVDAYSIVGGIPAKKIRSRFDVEVIDALLNLRWWEWSEEKLELVSANFCTSSKWTVEEVQKLANETK